MFCPSPQSLWAPMGTTLGTAMALRKPAATDRPLSAGIGSGILLVRASCAPRLQALRRGEARRPQLLEAARAMRLALAGAAEVLLCWPAVAPETKCTSECARGIGAVCAMLLFSIHWIV